MPPTHASDRHFVPPLRRATYEVRVEGRIDGLWSEWFSGLALRHATRAGCCETVILLPDADAARLHGLLAHIGALNLTLISARRLSQTGCERNEQDELDKADDAQ